MSSIYDKISGLVGGEGEEGSVVRADYPGSLPEMAPWNRKQGKKAVFYPGVLPETVLWNGK